MSVEEIICYIGIAMVIIAIITLFYYIVSVVELQSLSKVHEMYKRQRELDQEKGIINNSYFCPGYLYIEGNKLIIVYDMSIDKGESLYVLDYNLSKLAYYKLVNFNYIEIYTKGNKEYCSFCVSANCYGYFLAKMPDKDHTTYT